MKGPTANPSPSPNPNRHSPGILSRPRRSDRPNRHSACHRHHRRGPMQPVFEAQSPNKPRKPMNQ